MWRQEIIEEQNRNRELQDQLAEESKETAEAKKAAREARKQAGVSDRVVKECEELRQELSESKLKIKSQAAAASQTSPETQLRLDGLEKERKTLKEQAAKDKETTAKAEKEAARSLEKQQNAEKECALVRQQLLTAKTPIVSNTNSSYTLKLQDECDDLKKEVANLKEMPKKSAGFV